MKTTKASTKQSIIFKLLLPEEMIDFIKSLKKQMNMSWTNVISAGAKHMLEVKKDIQARIMLGDYVELYKTNYNPVKLYTKRRNKNGRYTNLFVYHIEKFSNINLVVFYKLNNDREDFNFQSVTINYKCVNKDVFDHFPVDIWIDKEYNELQQYLR